MAKVKSIMQNENECFICDTKLGLQEHHIFPGSFRNNSEKYGLKVVLCERHHTGDNGVHNFPMLMISLKLAAQLRFEETHSREEFIKEFGRSYL